MKNSAVVVGARLDFWCANAQGFYSGVAAENTLGTDYLRGWQTSNAKGQVTFDGIYPGPYVDRTNHVHLRIRLYDTDGVTTTYDHTTQIFFPASLTTEVMQLTAYARTSGTVIVNSKDSLYTSENEATVTGTTSTSFVAAYTIELPLTTTTSSSSSSFLLTTSGSLITMGLLLFI